MQFRFAILVLLAVAALIGLTHARAADPQRLYLPLQSDARPTGTPAPEGTRAALPSATPTHSATPTSTATNEPTATHTPTATATHTPTATSTATATATATATLTATPTLTPIPECVGIYPIGVDNEKLSERAFIDFGPPPEGSPPEWGIIEEGPYAGRTWSRLYVVSTTFSGNYVWLRWNERISADGYNASSHAALVASLTPPGNIQLGFEEAPWPMVDHPPRPEFYPVQPGVLNVGDWVWGSSGWQNSSALSAALDDHIATARPLMLPIYDISIGSGSNAQHRIVRLGAFILRDYGSVSGRQYLELIFIGNWDGCNVIRF